MLPTAPDLAPAQVFLVGGAVRDALLGLSVRERDYVVVGATPEQLLAHGFQQVGRDFPVFLHPKTHAEYALARTERKTAPGYRGFTVHAAPTVTLADDLARRDLTINALAQAADGQIIDPHGGRADLERRILRHISPAFAEDPVRILRVARFAARFAPLGFTVAPETVALMRQMVAAGEVNHLVPERVWQELSRALTEAQPSVFFHQLRDCGALAQLLPELDRLWGVPQPAKWHPEIDTGVHVMMVVDMAARLTADVEIRFAALCHDFGKGTTPVEILPSHRGHEERSVTLVNAVCSRLRVPQRWRQLAQITARQHGLIHRVAELTPATQLTVLEQTDAVRRPSRFEQLLTACEADFRGRLGYEEREYSQATQWRRLLAAVQTVDAGAIAAQYEESPTALVAALRQARLAAIKAAG
ncbi:multifunctional CCA addition/repair protein [Thiospirillum jenense]|uniref:Multifunctional CCA protein n=1 Tax=Thiospirillum jenense TaxID=1653858 RepID=A0A839HK52_9GAMM|nr:multifunctional CCA addition/repair protein [Thiospirillum jenense]MBB1127118.1 multifunctional CCA addition/repair protein [Thiospirillum jenense]